MLTPTESYHAAGMSAAQALNRSDSALADHWRTWMRRALRLETTGDALEAERAYDNGYRTARHVPRPEYFK